MALADKLTLVPSAQYGVVYGRFVQGVGGPSLVSGVDENPDAALSPVPGLRITFKPSTDLMISDPATQDSFAPTAYSAYTDGDGFFEISLFATNIEGASVENWYWEAEVYSQNPGNRSFRVGSTASLKGLEVRANTAAWLGDIITSQDASGNYVTQGKSAYQFAVEGGYEGSAEEFAVALYDTFDLAANVDAKFAEYTVDLTAATDEALATANKAYEYNQALVAPVADVVDAVVADPASESGAVIHTMRAAAGTNAALNGVTPGTASVGTALSDLIAEVSLKGGGTIILPPGVYAVPVVKGASNVTLAASPSGSVTLRATQSVSKWITMGAGTTNFHIRGIKLDATNPAGGTYATSYGIEVSAGCKNVSITDCELTGFNLTVETRENVSDFRFENNELSQFDIGVRLNKGPVNVHIRGNDAKEWTGAFVYVLGDATSGCKDLWINENTIQRHVKNAAPSAIRQPIRFHGQSTAQHKNVTIHGNTVYGADTNHQDTIDPGSADMISLHQCDGFFVTNNYVWGGGDVGITVAQECRNGVVTGNSIHRSDSVGLCLGSAASLGYTESVYVGGNTFVDCTMDRPDTGGTAIVRAVPRTQGAMLVEYAKRCVVAPNVVYYSAEHPSAVRRAVAWRESVECTIYPQKTFNATTPWYYDEAYRDGPTPIAKFESIGMTTIELVALTPEMGN